MGNTAFKKYADMQKAKDKIGVTNTEFTINITDCLTKHVAKISGINDDPEQWVEDEIENRYINTRLDTVTLEMLHHNKNIYYKYTIDCINNKYLQIKDFNEQEEITDKIKLEDLAKTLKDSEDTINISKNTFEVNVEDKIITISELRKQGNNKIIQILFCETTI